MCYWVGDTCRWIQREAQIIYAPGLSVYKAACSSLIIDGVEPCSLFWVAVCTLTIYVTPQQSVMKLASEVNHWTTGKSTVAMDGFRCLFTHPWNRKHCSLPSFYGFLLELQQNILVKPCDGCFCFQRNEVHAQSWAPRPVCRPHALVGRFTTELSGVVVRLHLCCSGDSGAHLDFMEYSTHLMTKNKSPGVDVCFEWIPTNLEWEFRHIWPKCKCKVGEVLTGNYVVWRTSHSPPGLRSVWLVLS